MKERPLVIPTLRQLSPAVSTDAKTPRSLRHAKATDTFESLGDVVARVIEKAARGRPQ